MITLNALISYVNALQAIQSSDDLAQGHLGHFTLLPILALYVKNLPCEQETDKFRPLTNHEELHLLHILLVFMQSGIPTSSEEQKVIAQLINVYSGSLFLLLCIITINNKMNQSVLALFFNLNKISPFLVNLMAKVVLKENNNWPLELFLAYVTDPNYHLQIASVNRLDSNMYEIQKGDYYFFQGNLDASELCYWFARIKNPLNLIVLNRFAHLAKRQGDFNKRREVLHELLAFYPGDRVIMRRLLVNEIAQFSRECKEEKGINNIQSREIKFLDFLSDTYVYLITDHQAEEIARTYRYYSKLTSTAARIQFLGKNIQHIYEPKWDKILGAMLDSLPLEERINIVKCEIPRPHAHSDLQELFTQLAQNRTLNPLIIKFSQAALEINSGEEKPLSNVRMERPSYINDKASVPALIELRNRAQVQDELKVANKHKAPQIPEEELSSKKFKEAGH